MLFYLLNYLKNQPNYHSVAHLCPSLFYIRVLKYMFFLKNLIACPPLPHNEILINPRYKIHLRDSAKDSYISLISLYKMQNLLAAIFSSLLIVKFPL